MQIALANDFAPRAADRGRWARLWGAVRSMFGAREIVRAGRASVTRPRQLPAAAPIGEQQARELTNGGAWQDHPGYGCTPARVVQHFRQAESGDPTGQCDLFDDLIERDATLRNLFEQRELAVAGKPSTIQAGGPGEVEERAARVLASAHASLELIATLQHQLAANRHGWAATEIDWETRRIDGRDYVVPVWYANVPARRFKIDTARNELRLVTAAAPAGEPLRPGKWLVTVRPGPLARAGLMRTAVWPALWKSFSTRDWLSYAEMFGIPLVQAIYDDISPTDDDSRQVAEEIVQRIGSSGGAVTPKTVEVKVHQVHGADNSGTHGSLIALANAELSKLINGATLANDNAGSGGASYALGAVHASTRYDLVVADAARLAEAWHRCVAVPFMRFNDLEGHAPRLGLQIVPELNPKTRLECADLMRNKLGIDVSISQLRNEQGFREPLGPDDAAPGAPAKAAPPAPGAA